ncbi:immunoglobulin-binding protein 1-like [Patiria miniata]|uniref:Immunoglobulin-binding protein 1 n=1 Tax=Patiria miniata TaxID=46514 RepID=A0A914A3P7_PATMI|nr:immunoglobulin-binding protein 1-like [Patiria miniata]
MAEKADDVSDAPKLSEIFEDSWRIQQELEISDEPTNSKSYQDALHKAIKMLEQATVMVSQLNLFSSNEELEELPTTDIRYLLLPALLGSLTLKLTGEDRLAVVERSKTYFKDFLRRCRQYGVTEEEIPEDQEARSQPPSGRPDLRAMQANREDKIRRYKQAKEMERKMQALGTPSQMKDKPEDAQREFYILCLKTWVSTALEELAGVQQEIEILQHMAKMKSRQEEQGANAEPKPPKEKPRQPMKPFILTRDAIQAQVFGAGYPSVPTMTLEEFYQKEIAEGKILPNSQNPTPASQREEAERREREKEEAVDRDDPEALRKARELDEFKDTHKRGCGNRENMG